jgi:aspartate/methionine/tyrosine aminotransferase
MFSTRLVWDTELNRISEAVRVRREGGGEILDLTESNPARAGLLQNADSLGEALHHPLVNTYDPSPQGSMEAREAIATYYAGRGQTVDPERILLTASTSESYSWLFKLLANPGDEVLVPRPSYPLFEFLAALESVRVVQYPLLYHDRWQIDFGALEALLTTRTRAIVVVNPNNPTGSFLKGDEWDKLRRLQLPVICDEVFSDFFFRPDETRVTSLAGHQDEVLSFSLSGLSKVSGIPQMKLGWMVLSGPEQQVCEALHRLELIADTYLSVGTPVQLAAPRLLALRTGFQEALAARLRANLQFLRGTRFRLLDVEGGWYSTVRVPRVRTEEEWVLHLLDRGVLVQPGFFYDFECEAYLVLSLLTPTEVFAEGCSRILEGGNEW